MTRNEPTNRNRTIPGGKRAARRSAAASKKGRLRPGELDKLVLRSMGRHKKAAPQTPSAVAKAIKRSPGAVANCLGRLEKQGKVRLIKRKPRSYELNETRRS